MMAIPMSTKKVLRKCMTWENKSHVLITELSLKVLGIMIRIVRELAAQARVISWYK